MIFAVMLVGYCRSFAVVALVRYDYPFPLPLLSIVVILSSCSSRFISVELPVLPDLSCRVVELKFCQFCQSSCQSSSVELPILSI